MWHIVGIKKTGGGVCLRRSVGGIPLDCLISELINTHDLFSACETLKKIDAYLSGIKTGRSSYCQSLCEYLCEWVIASSDIYAMEKPYKVVKPELSTQVYLTTFGFRTGKVMDTISCIRAAISNIEDGALAPSGNRLTPESAENVLDTMAGKMPYFEIIGKLGLLGVLLLNNSHKVYNSLCGVNAEGTRATVLMYHMKDQTVSPEYVFLHELGHVLQIALCGPDEVPEEFYRFQSSFFPQPLERGTPIAAEVFADAFAVAVMHGTALQKHIPFELDADVIGNMIERFFRDLMKNYRGQAS